MNTTQGRASDGAQYIRQQKGKSLLVWVVLLGPVTLWIPALYFQVSKNYFWRA